MDLSSFMTCWWLYEHLDCNSCMEFAIFTIIVSQVVLQYLQDVATGIINMWQPEEDKKHDKDSA